MDQARGPRGFPTDALSRPSGHGPAMAAVPCRGPAGPLFHSARLSAREGALPSVACPSPPPPKPRFPRARVPPHVQKGCAEGTSQIAHRNSEPALKDFFYVRFGTSLLHIRHPSPMSNLERPFCTCSRARGRSGPTGVRKERRSALPCAGWCGEQGCGRASRGAERRARPFGRGCARKAVPYRAFRRSSRNAPDDARKERPGQHIGEAMLRCAKGPPDVQKGRSKSHIGTVFQCRLIIPMCNLGRPFCTSPEQPPPQRPLRTSPQIPTVRKQADRQRC